MWCARYGPFWVSTTLVFAMAAAGNFANYLDTQSTVRKTPLSHLFLTVDWVKLIQLNCRTLTYLHSWSWCTRSMPGQRIVWSQMGAAAGPLDIRFQQSNSGGSGGVRYRPIEHRRLLIEACTRLAGYCFLLPMIINFTAMYFTEAVGYPPLACPHPFRCHHLTWRLAAASSSWCACTGTLWWCSSWSPSCVSSPASSYDGCLLWEPSWCLEG